MTTQLTYLIAKERQSELAHGAAQERLASQVQAPRAASSARRRAGRLLPIRWLKPAGGGRAARHPQQRPTHEHLPCEP
jgi:hypothetical protein